MSDVIKLLPDSVANQIAAGEVIQRPASVIKELVENAVDAGASDIRIFIKDAGRTLIQVVDNGTGMSETDARMAFERHATSKIREAGDLFDLHTMGFRGEALPSICAISQVELKTKKAEQTLGTLLKLNATKVESQEPVACEKGTSIMVKNLFFNVPARRKFLKTDNVELSNIMREFERLALVNNKIRMSIDTGNRVLDLRAASFKQRIADIWKNSLDMHLVPVNVETSLVKIEGFISRPEYARRRNPLQYFIVNGRNMRHPYFHKAVVGCYESLIASDTQPCYFLKFEVDPTTIDVNIHPTKNEIKFEFEQDIWPILQASVKAALGKSGAVPSIDFNLDMVPVEPLKPGERPSLPKLEMEADYNPFESGEGDTSRIFSRNFKKTEAPKRDKNWDLLYAGFMRDTHDFRDEDEKGKASYVLPEMRSEFSLGTLCIQYLDKYIITTSGEGIVIIDQRRAHIKILYEEFLRNIERGELPSQGLMFPDFMEIEPSLQGALEEVLPELNRVGFRLEYEEENRWKITGVPAMAKNINPVDIVRKMIDSVNDSGENYGKDNSSENPLAPIMALMMARSASISSSQKLTEEEMENIVSELFSLSDPRYTPNGNLIYHIIDENKLSSLFR